MIAWPFKTASKSSRRTSEVRKESCRDGTHALGPSSPSNAEGSVSCANRTQRLRPCQCTMALPSQAEDRLVEDHICYSTS
ncbi:hypothetical protein C8Q73DRAFT_349193 [Cubamyces lactineus]|nr:hypothetical protein C8Q73DRAFT_349193 [Cubamyces lactineus]